MGWGGLLGGEASCLTPTNFLSSPLEHIKAPQHEPGGLPTNYVMYLYIGYSMNQ